jgi:lantibiotic modifying enzyme
MDVRIENGWCTATEEAIGSIVDALTRLDAVEADRRPRGYTDPFLALLFAYAAPLLGRPDLGQKAINRLDTACESVGQRVRTPGLYGGLSGIAWVMQRVSTALREAGLEHDGAGHEEFEEAYDEVDAALVERLRGGEWVGEYDLISGLVGVGVYGLERLTRAHGHSLVTLVIERLEETATEGATGLTWHTPPTRLPAWQRAIAPQGYFNLGVAHGVPGIVAFLGHAWRQDVGGERAKRLLEGAIPWVLSQQLTEGGGARFPSWVAIGTPPRASRMAWCYGGLGVAAAVMVAARSLGRSDWEHQAIDLALLETTWPPESAGVKDACLCHGAAGNAHLFRNFYRVTGDARFHDAARRWYARTLEMRTPGEGVGGYSFWQSIEWGNPDGPSGLVDDCSFLAGSAGVALALLSAVKRAESPWDRLLLVDMA